MRIITVLAACLVLAFGSKLNDDEEKVRELPGNQAEPVVYAPLDEITGNTSPAFGAVVNLHNGPTLVEGHKGKAILTNNTVRSEIAKTIYMDLGYFDGECINNIDKCEDGYTVSFWYKKEPSVYTWRHYPALAKASNWEIRLGERQADKNKPILFYYGNGKKYNIRFNKQVTNDEWHHLAIVAQNRSTVKFYIDGELIADGMYHRSSNYNPTYTVEFGCFQQYTCINAAFDEIKFWEGAKSDSDIRDIFLT